MKQLAYILGSSLLVSMALFACDSGGTTSTGTAAGAGGSAGSSAAGSAGTTTVDPAGGAGGSAGANTAGADPFGGGGKPAAGAAGTGNNAGSGNAGTSSGGSGGGSQADCQACIQSSCGDEIKACQNDQACATLVTCLQKCSDAACQQKCISDNPDGKTNFDAFNNCGLTNCSNECGGSGGGTCGGLSTGNAQCDACFQESCCTESETCAGNPDCIGFINCLADAKCNNPQDPCFATCSEQHANGVSDANALNSCLGTNCQAACQLQPSNRGRDDLKPGPKPGFFLEYPGRNYSLTRKRPRTPPETEHNAPHRFQFPAAG